MCIKRPADSDLPAAWLAAGGTLLPFVPHLLGGTLPFEDDLPNYFWPVMDRVAQSLRAGRLPLWTADLYGGFPLFADSEAGTLFPLNWLLTVVGGLAGLRLVLMLAVVAAALAMFALARQVGLRRPAALVAAWSFALGGFVTGHLVHISMLNATWPLPLVILALDRALAARGLAQTRWFVAAGLLHALQWLAGHVQPPMFTWLIGAGWLCLRLGASPQSLAQRAATTVRAALVMGAVSAGAAAAQLLPSLELARQGARSGGVDYSYAATYALSPFDLIALVSPYFFQHESGVRWGLWANWETATYAGILPLGLALIAVMGGGRAERAARGVIGCLSLLAVFGLWFALSPYLPLDVYQWLHAVPGANFLRAPARFVLLFDFALPLLAGFGLQRILDAPWPARTSRAIAALSIAACVGLMLLDFTVAGWIGANRAATVHGLDAVVAALPHSGLLLPPERLFDFLQWSVWIGNPRLLVALLLLAGAALWLAASATGRLAGESRTRFALALVLVDMAVYAAWFWLPSGIEAPLNAPGVPPDPLRVLAWPGSGLHANRPLAYGLVAVDGYSSYEIMRQSQINAVARFASNRLLDVLSVNIVAPRPSAPRIDAPLNIREPLASLDSGTPRDDATLVVRPVRAVRQTHLVSALEYAPAVEQGATIGYAGLVDAAGEVVWRPVRAGVETAEWALSRPDVQAIARHRPAAVAAPFDAADEQGRRGRALYSADIDFGQAQTVTAVAFRTVVPGIRWHLFRVELDDHTRLDRWDLARFEPAQTDVGGRLVRNRMALARARLVPAAIVESDAGRILPRMLSPELDPRTTIVAEGDARAMDPPAGDAWAGCGPASGDCGTVAWALDEDTRLILDVRAPGDGWLLLADTWYPGWRATLDGAPAPIWRANYVQRAVRVPGGAHRIVFTYDPPWVGVGFAVSGISMAAALAVLAARSKGGRAPAG